MRKTTHFTGPEKTMTLALTLGRVKLVIEPLGERKFMMLLRLLKGSVRGNILKG